MCVCRWHSWTQIIPQTPCSCRRGIPGWCGPRSLNPTWCWTGKVRRCLCTLCMRIYVCACVRAYAPAHMGLEGGAVVHCRVPDTQDTLEGTTCVLHCAQSHTCLCGPPACTQACACPQIRSPTHLHIDAYAHTVMELEGLAMSLS